MVSHSSASIMWKRFVFKYFPLSDTYTNAITLQLFRNEDGTLVPDGALKLTLSDFVPTAIIDDTISLLPVLEIPYLKLAGFLQLGEAQQQLSETRTGIGRKGWAPGTRFLKRSLSPEETLSPGREKLFAEVEEEAEEKAEKEDGLYKEEKRRTKGARR
jgi:hypothetical protein